MRAKAQIKDDMHTPGEGPAAKEHPISQAVRSGLWSTVGYGAKWCIYGIGSYCSPRMQRRFEVLTGQRAAPLLSDKAAQFVEHVNQDGTLPLDFPQNIHLEGAPFTSTGLARRSQQFCNKTTAMMLIAGAAIAYPTAWSYSLQTAAALLGAPILRRVLYQTNNSATNIVLNGREIGQYVSEFFEFVRTLWHGERFTGINPFTRGSRVVGSIKIGITWLAVNSAIATSTVMFQGAVCAGEQLDEPAPLPINLAATGIVAILYFPDILKWLFSGVDRRTYGPAEQALRDKFADLEKAVETVLRYGNTADLETVLKELPPLLFCDQPSGETAKRTPGYIRALLALDTNEMLASLGRPNIVLNYLTGWVFKPASQIAAGTIVLPQTLLVRTVEVSLPAAGYGVLAPITALPRIPNVGMFFTLLSNFALFFFDQRLIAAGLKDFGFKLVGLFRSDHPYLGLLTFLSLGAAAGSTALSVVVMQHQTSCGIDTATGNHTDPGEAFYDGVVRGPVMSDFAQPMSITDAASINYSGNASLWTFLISTVGTLMILPLLSYCCGWARRAETAHEKRTSAERLLEAKMVQLRERQQLALALGRQFDQIDEVKPDELDGVSTTSIMGGTS